MNYPHLRRPLNSVLESLCDGRIPDPDWNTIPFYKWEYDCLLQTEIGLHVTIDDANRILQSLCEDYNIDVIPFRSFAEAFNNACKLSEQDRNEVYAYRWSCNEIHTRKTSVPKCTVVHEFAHYWLVTGFGFESTNGYEMHSPSSVHGGIFTTAYLTLLQHQWPTINSLQLKAWLPHYAVCYADCDISQLRSECMEFDFAADLERSKAFLNRIMDLDGLPPI